MEAGRRKTRSQKIQIVELKIVDGKKERKEGRHNLDVDWALGCLCHVSVSFIFISIEPSPFPEQGLYQSGKSQCQQ